MSDQPVTAPPPRGFVYFCEETLRYIGGGRAWLFFVPYLLGAIWLEPSSGRESVHGISPWLILLAYLVVFPPMWRVLLRATGLWRKRLATDERKTTPVRASSAPDAA